MKIIVPVKILKAHNLIRDTRSNNLALGGIFITKDRIISSNGPIILVSENKMNPRQQADYLVKIERIPAGAQMAVIDTDSQLVYFLDRIISQSMLADIDLTAEFVDVAGARIMRYKYPDVKPALVMTHGKLSSIRISAHVMSKIVAVTKAINSRSGEVELSFQSDKKACVLAHIKQGASVLNLYFKPMA